MEINNAVSLYFSPTGSTRRIVTEIARSLPWPSRELDVTDYSANDEVCRMTARELLLAGVPVYGGRVHATAVRQLKNIRGGDTPAVIVAVFGNRTTTTLLELKDLLEGQGFRVAAALAAVAEHNIMRSVAGGRPTPGI
ncbi:MAG: flavodoxin family protein [Cloacibacillus evryensis]